MIKNKTIFLACALIVSAVASHAFEPPPDASSLNKAFEGESYSPYAARSFPSWPLWGDTHLHTSTSFDAGAFGNRLDARAAYRFAKGLPVVHPYHRARIQIGTPLDFLVVSDHAEFMGVVFSDLEGEFEASEEEISAWYQAHLTIPGVYDVAGPEMLSYEDLMRQYGEIVGRHPRIFPVPVTL